MTSGGRYTGWALQPAAQAVWSAFEVREASDHIRDRCPHPTSSNILFSRGILAHPLLQPRRRDGRGQRGCPEPAKGASRQALVTHSLPIPHLFQVLLTSVCCQAVASPFASSWGPHPRRGSPVTSPLGRSKTPPCPSSLEKGSSLALVARSQKATLSWRSTRVLVSIPAYRPHRYQQHPITPGEPPGPHLCRFLPLFPH